MLAVGIDSHITNIFAAHDRRRAWAAEFRSHLTTGVADQILRATSATTCIYT